MRWRHFDGTALTGLDQGIITDNGRDLIAYAADGHELWRAPGVAGRVLVALGKGRIYVDTSGFPSSGNRRRVIALDAATGARQWTTQSAETTELLSVDGRGRALVAVRRGRLFSVRALGSTGRPAWHLNTASEVAGGA